MANEKLTDLSELAAAPAKDDWFYIVDKSDTTDDAAGSSKKILVSNALGSLYTYTTPNSVTITDGTSSDVVSDVQTFADGNVFDLTEATGVPGQDFEFDFNSVTSFRGITVMAYYDGATTHEVNLQVYNHNSSTWDTFITFEAQNDYNMRTILIPDGTNFINSGDLDIRFYHVASGNTSHHFYIEYLAILQ